MADSKPELSASALHRMESFKTRDLHGPENSIPLSPQWLLPKPGENKSVAATGDPPVNCSPIHGNRTDFVAKVSGNGDETIDTEKRKDVWRSALVEAERRENWRDEERDNTNIRRDRWREGDKDLGDHRRSDRWADNATMGRSPGEIRRLPSDRWNDTGNREPTYDARRESKWDTRWGREEKDMDNRREKWLESSKDGEGQREKIPSVITDNVKDPERESEHYPRPWRSNSLQSRGRGEVPYLSVPTPNKQAPGFSVGRGRGDGVSPGFSAGRGRGIFSGSSLISNPSNYSSLGAPSERWDTNLGNSSSLKYYRAKLLDIYRKCGMKQHTFARLPDGFCEIPLLTQVEALEPLALYVPSQEEEAVLEGIDRGEIVSSGAPQFSKDGALNRNRDDTVRSRRPRTGSRDDGIYTNDSHKEDSANDFKADYSHHQETEAVEKNIEFLPVDLKIGEFREQQALRDRYMDNEGSENEEFRSKHRNDSAKLYKDVSYSRDSSAHTDGSWRKQAVGEELQGPLHNWQDFKAEIHPQRSDDKDAIWSTRPALGKDPSIDHERNLLGTIVSREDGTVWHRHEVLHADSNRLKHQSSMESNRMLVSEGTYVEREKEGTQEGIRHIPPEELSLYYRDPQGDIQGPFSGADVIGWFEAGYFGIDLPVRLVNASVNSPFFSLGDVMPHLRMKSRAPPGFGTPKQGDVADSTIRNKFGSHGKVQANIIGSGCDLSMNDQKDTRETAGAEKKFMESLISGTFNGAHPVESYSLKEGGPRGFQGPSPGGSSSLGTDGGMDMNYAVGRAVSPYSSMERQKSLPNVFPYLWPARDAPPLVTNSETVPDSVRSLPQLSNMTADASSTISHGSQHVDLMSILKGAADHSGVSPINNVVKQWANYGDVQSRGSLGHGSVDISHQDLLDVHHLQRFAPVQTGFQFQHQRQQQQQQQPQPLMQRLMSLPSENLSGGMPLEQLLPSGLSQDPVTLNLIQQQQQQHQLLLSQLQSRSQASLPSQVSMLDQILMLRQQQQQQQQQQEKQQQLIPQVLLEQLSHQNRQETSYERAQASGALGNASTDHLRFRQPHDPFTMNANLPQQMLSPQGSVVDSLLHLRNHQAPRGANLPQQIQSDENLKHSQRAAFAPQQSLVAESRPSDVWGVSETDRLSKVQTASISLPYEQLEKASKEQHIPHQLDDDTHSSSVLSDLSLKIHDSQAPPQVEHILGVPVSPPNANVVLPEKYITNTGILTSSVADSLVGSPLEKVCLDKNMYSSDPMVSTAVHAEDAKLHEKQVNNDTSAVRETDMAETREVKKSSEKKSRKQKSAKMSSERNKGLLEVTNHQQVKQENETTREVTPVLACKDVNSCSAVQIPGLQSTTPKDPIAPDLIPLANLIGPSDWIPATSLADISASGDIESVARSSVASSVSYRAWKPAPCPKPKSLLEIQLEEQKQKAETEKVVSEVAILATPTGLPSMGSGPWAGAVVGSEVKSSRDVQQDVKPVSSLIHSSSGNLESGSSTKSKKSHLHDLLAEEVLAKTGQQTELPVTGNADKSPGLFTTSVGSPLVEVTTADDSEFVEAKDTKKSRKRAPKGKSASAKTTTTASSDPIVASVQVEKSKSSRQLQQEKEVLPVPPVGPSLGDFLPWKAESSSSPPAPAWSVDTFKQAKTTSLRDIQKEQERKLSTLVHSQPQVAAAPKVQTNRSSSGNSSTWQHSAFPQSPKKAAPSQTIAVPSNNSRPKIEDEFFWGPVNQTKQETEQPDFPSLSGKSLTPKPSTGKHTFGFSPSRQLSAGSVTVNKFSDVSLSSSGKGKKQLVNKLTEAKDFHDWCEGELNRLVGNNDTHFLEFCLKQSTTEAEMLLVENLGTFDHEREFIDKVLKYKELLSADVIEMAFSHQDVQGQGSMMIQSQRANINDIQTRKPVLDSRSGRDSDASIGNDLDASVKGGKKKSKRGKKVSPAVLGFSVESTTRIMKGEIQNIDD